MDTVDTGHLYLIILVWSISEGKHLSIIFYRIFPNMKLKPYTNTLFSLLGPWASHVFKKKTLCMLWGHGRTLKGLPCLRKAVEQPSRAYYMYCHDHLKRQAARGSWEDLCTLSSSASSCGPQLIEYIILLLTCICRYQIWLTSMYSRRWKEFEPRARAASQALCICINWEVWSLPLEARWFNWHVR